VKATIENTQQWFLKIKRMAASHAKMAQQGIHRHPGGTKEPAHLNQNKQHLSPE
jgi:hypothetical protein